MSLKPFLLAAGIFITSIGFTQTGKDSLAAEAGFTDYDALFSELDALLDSLAKPRSFTVFSVSMGNRFFYYESKSSFTAEVRKKFTYAPSVSYFDKSGLGVGADAAITNDGITLNPYQFSVAGFYDYQKNKRFLTGMALTRFFTKKNLPFYTSPLQNEVYAYFTYKKAWVKPTVALSYGWGNRKSFEEQEQHLQNIRLARSGFIRINTKESVTDFTLTVSLRRDFYFLKLLAKNDYLRITPQLSFVSGTQQFGFNQTSDFYFTTRKKGRSVLQNTSAITLDNQLYFQPISAGAYLKAEYAIGKFFIQPQLLFDYYFPATENNFSSAFILNTGFIF